MFFSKNISFLLAGVFSVAIVGSVTSSFSASGTDFCQNNHLETERCGAAVTLLRNLLLPEQPAPQQENKEQATTRTEPKIVGEKAVKQSVETAKEEAHIKSAPLGFVPIPRLRAKQFDPTQAVLARPETNEIKPAHGVQQASVTKANFIIPFPTPRPAYQAAPTQQATQTIPLSLIHI